MRVTRQVISVWSGTLITEPNTVLYRNYQPFSTSSSCQHGHAVDLFFIFISFMRSQDYIIAFLLSVITLPLYLTMPWDLTFFDWRLRPYCSTASIHLWAPYSPSCSLQLSPVHLQLSNAYYPFLPISCYPFIILIDNINGISVIFNNIYGIVWSWETSDQCCFGITFIGISELYWKG